MIGRCVRQAIAFAHPCARAGDTLHPRFAERRIADGGGALLSSILTLNK